MDNPFTHHPRSVNETYCQHLMFAMQSGLYMLLAGIACIIHGFFPFLCKNTGSDAIFFLANKLSNRCLNRDLNLQVAICKDDDKDTVKY